MMHSQTTWQETVVLPVGYMEEGNGKVHREATLRKMTGNEEALLADPKLRSNGGKLITALFLRAEVGVARILDRANEPPDGIDRRLDGMACRPRIGHVEGDGANLITVALHQIMVTHSSTTSLRFSTTVATRCVYASPKSRSSLLRSKPTTTSPSMTVTGVVI